MVDDTSGLDKHERVNISKTMSHALRHEPWLYELELDEGGWTPVPQLLAALRESRRAWRALDVADIEEVVRTSDKQRFELSGDQIRAHYGHSVPRIIRKEPAAPPSILYHGTSPATVPLIEASGLMPMARQYVHCSADCETAILVGKRKAAEPVILFIDAERAHKDGVPFYLGNELIWLADAIPPDYIQIRSL